MDELEKLIEQLKTKSAEVDELLGDDDRTEPLSDDETAQVDALQAECDGLRTAIDELKAKQEKLAEQRRKQAEIKAALSQPRPRRTTPDTPGGLGQAGNPQTTTGANGDRMVALRQVLPMRVPGRLRNFPNTEEGRALAYMTGVWFLAHLGDPTWENTRKAKEWCDQHLAMGTTDNPKGGVLVFPEFATRIIDLKQRYGVARANALVEPMASDTKTVPVATQGLTAYAVGENPSSDGTYSDSAWNDLTLTARKWMVLAKWSSELNADSIISMADTLAGQAAWALAKKEDECVFLGDGTSTYHTIQGLITKVFATAAAVYTAASTHTAFSTLALADFEGMVGQIAEYAEEPKWYISKVGWANSMLRLIEAAGGNTGPMIAGQAPKQFLGYDVVIAQVMNRTTTAQASTNGLCYLGDLPKCVLIGDRQEIRMMLSEHVLFARDQLAIRFTERFDVNVHNVGGRSGTDDASDNGPVIGLATPSS